jgi:monovalent cation/hydrogen antiporter
MDLAELTLVLALVVVTAVLSVAARGLGAPSSIFMLVVGIAVSWIPGLPVIELEPTFVLLLLIPPLLYSSGVGTSWRGFRSNLRPILLLAIGCTLFTAAGVAVVVHYAFRLPWPVGFVLGSIVSPPDSVAPMAIARRLGLPRRLEVVLEGESLVNDATALVAFTFALTAVATGEFSLLEAGKRFVAIVGCEIAYGILIGWAMLRLRHALSDPRAEVLLALVTPFVAFWPPHALGGSGVVACVASGLWVSWNGRSFIRSATRLQGYFIWDLVTWLVEAIVFLLTGLQARSIVDDLPDGTLARLLAAGMLVSLTVVVVRFFWVFPATYLPRILFPSACRNDPCSDWRSVFLVGFTGLRGVVSLAAALSIPITIGGQAFPHRDLVLFATFCVIVVTLAGQGSALPWVIRWLGLDRVGRAEADDNKRAERAVRLEGIDAVLQELSRRASRGEATPVLESLRRRHADRRARVATTADETTPEDPVADASVLALDLVDAERAAIARAYNENRITDEARRRIERELDLEEARVRHLMASVAANPGRAR